MVGNAGSLVLMEPRCQVRQALAATPILLSAIPRFAALER